MKGLAPHTLQVFEAVSKLDCIKWVSGFSWLVSFLLSV